MTTDTLEKANETAASNPVASNDDTSQLVTFQLADEEYAVDIMYVQEIILIGSLTEMPGVSPAMRGLINLRGHIIPVIDLRVLFELEARDTTEHSRIIVLDLQSRTIGIVVDAVHEVLHVEGSQTEPLSAGIASSVKAHVSGLVKLENKLLIMLDIERLASMDDV